MIFKLRPFSRIACPDHVIYEIGPSLFQSSSNFPSHPASNWKSESVPEKESTADTGVITVGWLSRDGNAKELRNE
jgi:hypothetical protein